MVKLEQSKQWNDAETRFPLFICLLGDFRLLNRGQPVGVPRGGKTEALLSLLVVHNESCIVRDTLLSLLWPGQDLMLAGQSLNSLVYDLRKHLKDKLGGASPILQSYGCYRLNYDAGISSDILRFDAFIRLGNERWHNGSFPEAILFYNSALRLYHGDLCGGTDLYTTIERERIRVSHLTVLARLADYYYAQYEYEAARDFAQRILASDPCREDAHRIMMLCYLRLGQRAEALRQYQLCAQILRAEFDACPEPATTALYEQARLNPDSIDWDLR
jgi:DNA-binding SARP family transcriptional activator